ncbi:MAG: peptide deformylase [Candidatus Omnitrophota bacterium]
MSVLEIKKYPDEVLRKRSRRLAGIGPAEEKLARNMLDTMYFSNGVGLAAPQVGILKRIIVCNPTGQKKDELVLINPKIIKEFGRKVSDCEGCLSIPEMSAEVKRASKAVVEAQDSTGRVFRLEAEGLLARIIYHETDHLDGVLFIDRLSILKKMRVIRKYKKRMGISCIGRSY